MAREDAPFLTLQDIKSFLASCENEDEVGIPANMDHCLAAETLLWKYRKDGQHALRQVKVSANNMAFDYSYTKTTPVWHEGFIDRDVVPHLDAFDELYNLYERPYDPITKEELLDSVPAFADLLTMEDAKTDTSLLDAARGYVKQRNELRQRLQENIKQGIAVHRSLALLQELDEQEMFEQKLDEMLLKGEMYE